MPPIPDQPTGLASRLRIAGQPILGVVEKPGGDTARQTESVTNIGSGRASGSSSIRLSAWASAASNCGSADSSISSTTSR